MPAEYRAWIKGDIGQLVRMAVPHVGKLLSGLLGSHVGPAPAAKWPGGLFGLGRSHLATTRPDADVR
jgi:hypothetical protein